jgi:hypothetical protein
MSEEISEKSEKNVMQNQDGEITNAELKKLLDKTLIRFENWKMEVNKNPNPRIVHSLKNILSIINSISDISHTRIKYSYKILSKQIAMLSHEVSALNLAIMNSIMDDDYIDEHESQKINNHLGRVIQTALQLIKIVHNAFGTKIKLQEKQIEQLR